MTKKQIIEECACCGQIYNNKYYSYYNTSYCSLCTSLQKAVLNDKNLPITCVDLAQAIHWLRKELKNDY